MMLSFDIFDAARWINFIITQVALSWKSFMQSFIYAECRKWAHYAECRYVECNGAYRRVWSLNTNLPLLAEIPDGDDAFLSCRDELVVTWSACDRRSAAFMECEALNLLKKHWTSTVWEKVQPKYNWVIYMLHALESRCYPGSRLAQKFDTKCARL